MRKIERTIVTTAPMNTVWAYLSDFTNTEGWDPPTVSTTRLAGDGGEGTEYENVSRLAGRRVHIRYTVVKHEPPRLLQLTGHTSTMRMLDTIRLTEMPSGVQVRYEAEFHPHGLARLVEPLLPFALKRLGDRAEAQLTRCLDRLAADAAAGE